MTRTARRALVLLLVGVGVAATSACGPSDAPRAGDGVQERGESLEYPLVEGDVIFVDPTRPLPANVRNDIRLTSQEVVDAAPATDGPVEGDPGRAVAIAVSQKAAWAEDATGREISIVYRVWGAPDVGGSPGTSQWLWAATKGAPQTAIADKATRVAEVKAFVATQDDPTAWEIIVLT
jgi:hypothetical protein